MFAGRLFRPADTVQQVLRTQPDFAAGEVGVQRTFAGELLRVQWQAVFCALLLSVWTTRETRMSDLRIRQSPRTRHPDFEMYQYNCTEEAARFFDKSAYPWDFAVPRQGFKDYSTRETDPQALDRRVQWIFFKAKNKKVLSRLKKLDFETLSRKNSTIPGFGKADVVEEYERLYPMPATNTLIQTQLNL